MVIARRVRVADAAVEVIADEGLRGLTHRAVDARAGLPEGSASSCFRTRLALLRAVLDRVVELDEAALAGLEFPPGDAAAVADALTGFLEYSLGPGRARTRARLELYLDAARRPGLREPLAAANARFLDRAASGLAAAGVADPRGAARLLLAQLDGLLYDALARPFAPADRAWLRRAVGAAVRSLQV
ncbi:TetR/AcrR family transcriptional regulator [Streptomonospora nanhaiensis]|uniref:DNA-binding transcriptional regulator YbjK n=1 Tax=Streptomonospora nanhaiensis TaxID=1323731 RepID=A0A853BR21_9ACTN|nr:TetR/AcrR family transcriptional regulator [Streptomonospora nanhaiensis]MBV2364005.1 TetR family transcriptional regulator [Streptomonospora nanhaiensis]MBX9387349.1 TetR family transcriptional regulator [Streptomonospora nanhaiensis]NYI97007.1 DNA-binding transcriptional regulator YbjK [Streptomonospora nanhaiensis]